MDCTQALEDDFHTNLCIADDERKQVGWLEVGGARHEVLHGDNRIGRDSSLCQIVIDSKTLSKEHAVIEVCGDGTPFLYDLGSLNKTRLGKTVLQPEARYQLLDGSEMTFADIKAVYKQISDHPPKDDDSGSETGSESMLNISGAEDNLIPATPATSRLKPNVIEETIIDGDAEDKQKPTSKSPETASTTEAPSCSTGKQQSNQEAEDIYEADTQADEFYASVISEADNSRDGPNITNDMFEAETQCDENYVLTEEQENEGKDESINRASRKVDTTNTDQEKSICEVENQSLDHISPSQNTLKQSCINKLNREGVTIPTNITFEDNKSLSASSEKVNTNSETSCREKTVTFSENNNLEKNNNCNKVGAPGDSSKTPADKINPVLDSNTDDNVDESIYEADTLCMESDFQFCTPKRPLLKKDTIEESENEEDITEMPTQIIDLQSPLPNQQKLAEARESSQDISEMETQLIDLEQPAFAKKLKSSETEDAEQDISEMATLQIDLEQPVSTKQFKSSDTKDTEQDISEMATQQLDLQPASSDRYKSAETIDSEEDISDMLTQKWDSEPASANQLKSAEIGNSEQKNLCAQVGKSESETDMDKADKQKNLSSENVKDPSSPSLLQEDNENLNGQEQGCSDEFNKKNEQMKGLNESTGKDKVEFLKNNVVESDLAVNKETYKAAHNNVAADSGDETDSENIFEAQTQLLCENNESTTVSKRFPDMHGEGQTKKENGVISETGETKSTEIIRHLQEDDEDTKSEDVCKTYLQAKTEEDGSSSPSMINNAESSEQNAPVLQHSNLEKSKECNENGDSVEIDIYEANTQIIDFDGNAETNVNINDTRKDKLENKINVTTKPGNHSVLSNPKECANRNITDSKNSAKHNVNNDAEITRDSNECTAEGTAAQKFRKVPNKTKTVSKLPRKRKISTRLEEQDTENIFEAATQVIEDQKPVSPQPCTSKPLHLEEKRALGSRPTDQNSESEDCGFSELETQLIENEPYHTSAKLTKGKRMSKQKKVSTRTEVELKSKQEGMYHSSHETSESSNQANQATESDDSLMDAPTQILNEGTYNMSVNKTNISNKPADTSCSKNKNEQDFEIKTHRKRHTPKKNQGTADNEPTTSVENQRTKNEMQDQISPARNLPADEEVAISPMLPSRISKRVPVGKRRSNRNISSELEKSATVADDVKTRNKNAAGVSKQNESLEDGDDQCHDSSTSSILETSAEIKQSSSKEIQGHKKRSNQGNKTKDSTSENVSVHSKNKAKDTTESPARNTSQNLRPSRQKKMTWKVRESLLSDQETPDDDKSSRKRNIIILDNSDAETSSPIKARKESSTKTDKPSSKADSVSEHPHSEAIRRRGKPDVSEQSSSYQKNENENASLTDFNTSSTSSRTTKRKAPDLQFPSSSKRSKGETQKSTEKEDPAEGTNATSLAKKDKSTESKTDVRSSRTTRGEVQKSSTEKENRTEDTNTTPLAKKDRNTESKRDTRSGRTIREVQKSTERENPTEDTNATVPLAKKDKSTESKTDTRSSRTTRRKSESATEVAVTPKRETRQSSNDKGKSKNLKKQSSFSNVIDVESESEPELEAQAAVSTKSKSRKGNAKASLSLAGHNKNLQKQNSFSDVIEVESESEPETMLEAQTSISTKGKSRKGNAKASPSIVKHNKNLKKQSSFSNVIEVESESEPELEAQASVSTKSKSRKGNAKASLRLMEHNKTPKESKSDLENQEEENLSALVDSNSKLDLPQRRSRRTAKEVGNEKHSKNLRQKKINVEETLDPGGSSKENENNTKMETKEKGRSSSKRKRNAGSADTILVENEEYSESPSKTSRPNFRKASGKPLEVSDIAQLSSPSTSKSSSPYKGTPQKLSRKRGKNSIITPEMKEDQSHSKNDIVNIDSSDDIAVVTPKRPSRRGNSKNDIVNIDSSECIAVVTPKRPSRRGNSKNDIVNIDSSDDIAVVTPKRPSRKGNSQNIGSPEIQTSTPQRSTPRRAGRNQEGECHVLFTGISNAKHEAIVKSLGGTVVDLPESCTVLVTDKVRRTFKFLCIMGKGKPIVSPIWLTQSKQAGKFLDPWKYLIKDEESETKFHFSLKTSLERASKTNLLAGYNIFVTPKVLPPPPEMRGIVESCGGTYIPHWPSSNWPEKSFIISCKEDKAQWTKLKKSGKPIVGAEILLLGILQQKLDIKSNTLV